MVNVPPRHLGRRQLAVARLAGQRRQLARDVDQALLVDVADDRHDEALRRVGREAEVVVLLEDEVVAVERGVELRELLQRRHAGLEQQGDHRELHALLRVLLVRALAEGLQLGDVRLVEVRDVRDHHPVARQHRAADLLDPRQRLRARPGRTSRSRPWATAGARGPAGRRRRRRAPPWAPPRRGAGRRTGTGLGGLDVGLGDAALARRCRRPGRGRRRARARAAGRPGSRRRCRTARPRRAGAAAGAGAAAAGAGAAGAGRAPPAPGLPAPRRPAARAPRPPARPAR